MDKLLKYRGGCVLSLDWGNYSDVPDILDTVYVHWEKVSEALTRRLFKLESEGVSPDNMYMYGHSLGARLVVDVGLKFGEGKIFQIDGKKY